MVCLFVFNVFSVWFLSILEFIRVSLSPCMSFFTLHKPDVCLCLSSSFFIHKKCDFSLPVLLPLRLGLFLSFTQSTSFSSVQPRRSLTVSVFLFLRSERSYTTSLSFTFSSLSAHLEEATVKLVFSFLFTFVYILSLSSVTHFLILFTSSSSHAAAVAVVGVMLSTEDSVKGMIRWIQSG